MASILIIEDEASIRNVLRRILEDENSGYKISIAENGESGLKEFKNKDFDLILCDIKMPKVDGVEVLDKVISEKPETPVVMISGHGDIVTAVSCIKKGAYDYISKPPDLNRLLNTVRNALSAKSLIENNKILATENQLLRKKISENYKMIGSSKAMNEIKNLIDKVAITDARVLITGPNGSGKELVAHWIYQKSRRSKYRMIEVNCAAIPPELIESELFGHEKGSFTGAFKQKKGKFEEAHLGTLFLDEIGDMSLSAQAKVLRVLQEGRVTRVGGDKSIKVNVRVLAATNKNLKEEIEKGRFREDLYHRLAVILIEVPSLNERREDIPELIDFFSKEISESQGLAVKTFDSSAINILQKLDWTGNIREFRNVLERLIILGGVKITAKDVELYVKK